MSERRFPITRKQHDRFVQLITEQSLAQQRTATYCDSILDGLPDGPRAALLKGVNADNGVYEMVLDVPDENKTPPAS